MTTPLTFPRHFRALLVLGLPLVGGHLAQFAIGLTDTIMVGWYGVPELAALTLANSLFFTLFLIGSGFAWAILPMVASFAAEQNEVMIRRATRMGLWLSIGVFVACVPLLWFSGAVFRLVGQDPELAAMAQSYLRIALWGMLPALTVMVLKSFLAALEHTQVILWITVLSAVVNAFGNYALIFGNFGAPELGITGAAIASLITSVAGLLGVLVYTRLTFPQYPLWLRFWRPDPEVLRDVFQLGWPIALTSLSETGLFLTSALMMGTLGTVPLAAHGIALQLASATFMVHMGLSNAATVRAGNAYGRRDSPHLALGAKAAFAASVLVALATIAVFVAIPGPLIDLFLSPDDPDRVQIIAVGASLILMAGLFQLVDGGQVIALGLLRGVQDTKVPMILAAVAYWGVGLPASYIFGFTLALGGVGIWLGLVLGLAMACVLLSLRFWRHAVPGLARMA